MKNLTLINASPRRNGTTKQLIDTFLSVCNHDVKIYNIYDEKIAPCIGCDSCSKTGKCIYNDSEDKIVQDILSSDFVVFATPIYCYSFPAPMKAFLDRLQPYYSDEKYKNPAVSRKGFVLATCGKSGKFGIDVIEKQSRIAFIELSASFDGIYLFSGTDKCSTLQEEEKCKVISLTEEFFNQAF